jgi:hypothetical protein
MLGSKHSCLLDKPKVPSKYPRIAVVSFELMKDESGVLEPYFCTIFIERDIRGKFIKWQVAADFMNMEDITHPQEEYSYHTYWPENLHFALSTARNPGKWGKIPIRKYRNHLKKKGNFCAKVATVLLQKQNENTVFLVSNSTQMCYILRGVSKLGLKPKLIHRQRNLMSINCAVEGVRFVNFRSYFDLPICDMRVLVLASSVVDLPVPYLNDEGISTTSIQSTEVANISSARSKVLLAGALEYICDSFKMQRRMKDSIGVKVVMGALPLHPLNKFASTRKVENQTRFF